MEPWYLGAPVGSEFWIGEKRGRKSKIQPMVVSYTSCFVVIFFEGTMILDDPSVNSDITMMIYDGNCLFIYQGEYPLWISP